VERLGQSRRPGSQALHDQAFQRMSWSSIQAIVRVPKVTPMVIKYGDLVIISDHNRKVAGAELPDGKEYQMRECSAPQGHLVTKEMFLNQLYAAWMSRDKIHRRVICKLRKKLANASAARYMRRSGAWLCVAEPIAAECRFLHDSRARHFSWDDGPSPRTKSPPGRASSRLARHGVRCRCRGE